MIYHEKMEQDYNSRLNKINKEIKAVESKHTMFDLEPLLTIVSVMTGVAAIGMVVSGALFSLPVLSAVAMFATLSGTSVFSWHKAANMRQEEAEKFNHYVELTQQRQAIYNALEAGEVSISKPKTEPNYPQNERSDGKAWVQKTANDNKVRVR